MTEVSHTATETVTPDGNNLPWTKSYHPNVKWEYEDKAYPVYELIDRAQETYGEKTYLSFLGRDYTYSQISNLVNRAAKGLQGIGVTQGTKVGLMFPNTPAYIIFYYAILKAGGVVVNFNPLYTVPELEYQIQDSDTEIMISHDLKLLFEPIEELLEKGVLKKAVICPFTTFLSPLKSFLFPLVKGKEISKVKASSQKDKIHFYKDIIDNDGQPKIFSIVPEKELAVLQYTGGTTGRPKGAMLSHGNLTHNVNQATRWGVQLAPGEDVFMAILPFFHVFGMTGLMNIGTASGVELVLIPRFEAADVLKQIEKKRVTVLPGVPTIFIALMSHPNAKKADLSSLRDCVSGGAPLPLEVFNDWTSLSGANMPEGYGLSETSPVAVSIPTDGPREGAVGVPISGTFVEIRSLENPEEKMPLGEKGEICIKGPQVMMGYWKRPDATAEVMLGDYFRTGDVGYMDEDGYIFIVDRIKDLIICSGFNVYPRQIEEAIYEHPAVEETTVIGIPNKYRGEAPKAFVKLREGKTVSKEDLMAFLTERLSKIELPEEIDFKDELPKTMIGKLSKKELRQEEEKAQ